MRKLILALFALVVAGAAIAQQELPRFGETSNNHRPSAKDDFYQIREGTKVVFDVLANDMDQDGDQLAITHINGQRVYAGDIVTLPSGAMIQVLSDGKVAIAK